MKLKTVLFTLLMVVVVGGCVQKETWQGFYYPDGCLSCHDQYIYSPIFNNRAPCLSWATELKQKRNNPTDEFECGKNCKAPATKDGFYECKETVDY